MRKRRIDERVPWSVRHSGTLRERRGGTGSRGHDDVDQRLDRCRTTFRTKLVKGAPNRAVRGAYKLRMKVVLIGRRGKARGQEWRAADGPLPGRTPVVGPSV